MAPKKKATKPAKKAAAAPKKAAPARLSLKLLAQLPPTDERRRRVYRKVFSDEQCDTWGKRTKAVAVRAEAERMAGALFATVTKRDVMGYSAHRLAWLCELISELEDNLAAQAAKKTDTLRAARTSAVMLADLTRKKLVAGLLSVAGGNTALREEIEARNETSTTPHVLESSLAGLVQLALKLRHDNEAELLCDDAGLSESYLSSITGVIDGLREANELTYGTELDGNDSAQTNRVEGRVLREMAFAVNVFRRARENGETVPPLLVGPTLRSVVGHRQTGGDEPGSASAATPS